MGTQQLLLIVLGAIIVGVAITIGVTLFKSNAQTSNRDQVVADLQNLGAVAQQFYRKPTSFGGGGQDFQNFTLTPLDTGNGNGSFSVSTSIPDGAGYVSGNRAPITTSGQLIYIVGCGNETGNDGTDPVKAYLRVTGDSLDVNILN